MQEIAKRRSLSTTAGICPSGRRKTMESFAGVTLNMSAEQHQSCWPSPIYGLARFLFQLGRHCKNIHCIKQKKLRLVWRLFVKSSRSALFSSQESTNSQNFLLDISSCSSHLFQIPRIVFFLLKCILCCTGFVTVIIPWSVMFCLYMAARRKSGILCCNLQL